MPLVRLSVCVSFVLVVMLAVLDAQQPAERRVAVGSSEIAGTVIAADTHLPIRGACVSLSGDAADDERANSAPGSGGTSNGPRTASAPSVGVVLVTIGRANAQPVPADRSENSAHIFRKVFTDADGRFVFPRLPAGRFSLSVSHRHYFEADYGQRRPYEQGRTIQIADGERRSVAVAMTSAAVVTGRVVAPDGEPQRGADVRFWRFVWDNGSRRLESGRSTSTDDRGVYRMFGLLPGDYVVSATPDDSDEPNAERDRDQADLVEKAIVSGRVRPPAARGLLPTVSVLITPETNEHRKRLPYLETFAPSASAPSSALKVTLVGGEEKTGVDICLRLIQAGSVEGGIQTPLDSGTTVQLWLVSDDRTIDGAETAFDKSNGAGKFGFWSVTPGNYTLFAQAVTEPAVVNGVLVPAAKNFEKKWGKAHVTVVSGEIAQVSVSLEPTRSVSGVVVFEMARPSDIRPRSVSLDPAPAQPEFPFAATVRAQVGPDGRFTMTGVVPGRYVLRGSDGTTKSSIITGQDTLDFPYEITGDRDVTDAVVTLTNSVSELSGTLVDGAGKPADDVTIVVASSDTRYWTPGSRRVAVARPEPDGRYTIRGLPPGAYLIAAVKDLDDGEEYDPGFLRTLVVASVPVTIMDGGKVRQDLRVK